jgi:uncharacterized OB-fold protein
VLTPQSGPIPAARANALSTPFWEGCTRGELLYQYFPSSGTAQFNPAPVDRVSLSRDFEWRASSGRGVVYSYSTVWRPQTGAFEVPYVVVIVTLDEGYQMVSNLIGCEVDDVRVDLPVEVEFVPVNDGLTLPYFRPIAN